MVRVVHVREPYVWERGASPGNFWPFPREMAEFGDSGRVVVVSESGARSHCVTFLALLRGVSMNVYTHALAAADTSDQSARALGRVV